MSTRQIYAGTQGVPTSVASGARAIGQLMRLHFTEPGRFIHSRVEARMETRAALRKLIPGLKIALSLECRSHHLGGMQD